MKKLLVTAIGAAAALGAYATDITTQLRFENMAEGETTVTALNTEHAATYWSEGANATNTYTVEARTAEIVAKQTAISGAPNKALSVKTTFGKPLSVNVVAGGAATAIGTEGIYFDSLVKFTVCEDTPDQEYEGAKIVMWLQEQYDENDNVTGTNLYVKAGYLTGSSITNSSKVYRCNAINDGSFADKFHRVTIKAIDDITESSETVIPGFAIYIDGNDTTGNYEMRANAPSEAKWDADFSEVLTEAAKDLNDAGALFPSMIQQGEAKTTLTAASFDGTGSITDIIITNTAPKFAKDYAATKATVWNGDEGSDPVPYTTLEEALNFVNQQTSGTYTFKLAKGMDISAPLAFTSSANVILDFAGFVLTNDSESVAAITANGAGKLIITNSTVAVGGVRVLSVNASAIVQGEEAGVIDIYGGNFWGAVTSESIEAKQIQLYGGSFQNAYTTWLADDKTFSAQSATYEGLYDVIDYVEPTYTVTFVYGLNGQSTNETANLSAGDTTPAAPAEASITGYTLTWSPALAATVTEDATYTAQYVAINYTISFVNEADSTKNTSVTKAYGTTIAANEVPVWTAADGYTGAWDTDPANAAVSGDATYTWSQTGKTFTIVSYTNGVQYASVATQYAGEALTPASLTVDSATQTWDGKWYTENGGNTEFVFDPAGDLTQSAYATITPKGSTYPTYIDSTDSTITGQYEAWAQSYGVDATSAHEAAFLLNVDPTTGDTTLDTTAVTISGTTVTITLDHNNINGYPYYKAASTVAGLASATKVAITTERSGAVITLTEQSGDAKFYQIGISSKSDLSDD